jgi:membrane-associated phospholipid phosphatase
MIVGVLELVVLSVASSAHAADPDKVEWSADWPRVRWSEVATVVGLTVGSFVINAAWTPPDHATWNGPILFDKAVRNLLVGRTYAVQEFASNMSDDLYKGAVLAPYAFDVFLASLSVHENADVALQMLLIDMQSLGLTGVATLATEHAVGRARPYVRDCRPDGSVVDASGKPLLNGCGTQEDFQSFYSGHTAATATMAGLTCVHHQHLPLYGDGPLNDIAPCAVMITASLATGVTRIIADRHWASDVLVGAAVGGFSGYVLPSMMHYGFGSGRPVGEVSVAGVTMVPFPTAYVGGAGLGLAGIF